MSNASAPRPGHRNPSILITGGAGFIGVNSARYFAEQGWDIAILDNLSRRGTEDNLNWLREQIDLRFERADIRDPAAVDRILADHQPDLVLHLAAQVAVTTSVTDPREDFEINALGTFNLLEAVRRFSPDSFIITASTNKVYGKMAERGVVERNGRYEYADLPGGVDEQQPLDCHSPYGCSKGTADQYTLDYSRIYGLKTTSFRQSCIYGTRQFGIEDQGWVAWFTIAAVLGKPITLYGDGKQIRDVLQVDDLARPRLRRSLSPPGPSLRPSLQHRRWAGQHPVPAGTTELSGKRTRHTNSASLERLAPRRPARVRLQPGQGQPPARLAPPHRGPGRCPPTHSLGAR